MHFLPILSTLRRHRTAAALIVLEIAFTCAIVCNAVFLIGERLSRMDKPSGLAEDEIVRVQLTGIGTGRTDAAAITAQDLVALRGIPGVKAAAVTNMVPFGNSSWNSSVSTIPDDPNAPSQAAMYTGSPGQLEALGVKLIAGRDFTPGEFAAYNDALSEKVSVPSIILTVGAAEALFPGKSALGQAVYVFGKDPQTVVGIVEHIERPNNGSGSQYDRHAMFLPLNLPYTDAGNYVLRTDPARRGEVLAAVDAVLDKVDPRRIILKRQIFPEVRSEYFRQDRSMAFLLLGVTIALLIVTALGIVGLASFWVQQRTRQIGVRRALGATRTDIVRYFQAENFVLTSLGIILGMGLAYAMGLLLTDMPRLPAMYLPIGAALLWSLGQIAVLGPAMRASLIPPAIATRSV